MNGECNSYMSSKYSSRSNSITLKYDDQFGKPSLIYTTKHTFRAQKIRHQYNLQFKRRVSKYTMEKTTHPSEPNSAIVNISVTPYTNRIHAPAASVRRHDIRWITTVAVRKHRVPVHPRPADELLARRAFTRGQHAARRRLAADLEHAVNGGPDVVAYKRDGSGGVLIVVDQNLA